MLAPPHIADKALSVRWRCWGSSWERSTHSTMPSLAPVTARSAAGDAPISGLRSMAPLVRASAVLTPSAQAAWRGPQGAAGCAAVAKPYSAAGWWCGTPGEGSAPAWVVGCVGVWMEGPVATSVAAAGAGTTAPTAKRQDNQPTRHTGPTFAALRRMPSPSPHPGRRRFPREHQQPAEAAHLMQRSEWPARSEPAQAQAQQSGQAEGST